jgi:hypothetical protein
MQVAYQLSVISYQLSVTSYSMDTLVTGKSLNLNGGDAKLGNEQNRCVCLRKVF